MDETVTRLFAAAVLGSGDSGPIADCGYQYRYSLNIRFNEGGRLRPLFLSFAIG